MIFVTGGTGLVGSHLLHALISKGEQVRALYRSEANKTYVKAIFNHYQSNGFDQIEWLKGDLMDYFFLKDALKNVHTIYHCAAMVSFKPSDRDAMFSCNVDGTANLVNAAIESRTPRFCHVSSISTLGKTSDGQLIDEGCFWQNDDNHSVYSQSKFRAEMEVWRGTKEGLNAVILNPSIILGPCPAKRSSGPLIHTLSKNMIFYTGGGSGFVDVRDVAQAMIAISTSKAHNERFIINGENLSYLQLTQTAARVFKVKPPRFKANRLLTGIAWRMERLRYILFGLEPKMTKETARSSQNQSKFSNQKLLATVDIKLHSVEEALQNAANFWSH